MLKRLKTLLLCCVLGLAVLLQGSGAQAAAITGKIGIGTWNTQAEFTDIRVVKGSETLYQSDFSTGLSGFQTAGGTWTAVNGSLRQTSGAAPALAFAGDPSWSDYTLTLKARKISGAEGFLISFGVPAENSKSWWNIAGWGNTQHALEAPGVWAPAVPGSIQTGVWYDIRIELQGANVRCYLNGALIHDTTPRPVAGRIGVGTWNTQAEFTDIRVVKGTETLYQSDFATGLSGFIPTGGTWTAVNGNLRQTSAAAPALALVGSASWSDYTLTLKARKLSGAEGFIITFGSPGAATKSWWNIGGWGNTQHALEAPGFRVPGVPGPVQTGRWYEIRVELEGPQVRCYLDGIPVHDTERVLDDGDRARRFQQMLSSQGFGLLNSGEQDWLRNLAGRGVYVGAAARATFGQVPGRTTFENLAPGQQAALIRKVNRHRLTFGLGWGFGSDLARDQAIIDGMDAAVEHINAQGPIFDKHDIINNSPGTPTADANWDGQIRFGGSIGQRVSLHEISHTLGVGTFYPAWGSRMVNGAWTGQYTNTQLSQFDGPGSVLHGDGMHFWPYGLNYENEGTPEASRRHVWIVHAIRRDMGIATFDLAGATDVPDGLYRLTPRHAPNSSLDVLNGNAANGGQIDIRTYTGTDSQKFYLDLQGDGSYRIRTALAGNRAVDLPNGVTDNGTRLRLWDDIGTVAQRWYLTPVGDGWYRVSPRRNSYRSMDVRDLSTANGAPVQTWDYLDGFNQQWRLTLLAPAYSTQELLRALSVSGGLATVMPAEAARLDAVKGNGVAIDVSDAAAIARKRGGLDPNP